MFGTQLTFTHFALFCSWETRNETQEEIHLMEEKKKKRQEEKKKKEAAQKKVSVT